MGSFADSCLETNRIEKKDNYSVLDAYDNMDGQFQHFFPQIDQTTSEKLKQTKYLCRIMLLLHCLSLSDYQLKTLSHKGMQTQNLLKCIKFVKVKQFLAQNRIQFSLDSYCWKNKPRYNEYNYYSKGKRRQYSNQQQKEQKSLQQLINNNQLILKISLFITLLDFNNKENVFLSKLSNVSDYQQKIRYIIEFSEIREPIYQNFNFYKQQKDKHQTEPQTKRYFWDKVKLTTIADIHERQKDYKWLESQHDYIQWMFPNHYTSKVNSSSFPLEYKEAVKFRQDEQVGRKMLKSIQIFFDFLGIELNKQTLHLKLINIDRLIEALIQHTHNHFRIMRVLACLSVVGFRIIALNLISFLKCAVEYRRFKKLKRVFDADWAIYDDNHLQAKKMCFLFDDQFPQNHLILRQNGEIYRQSGNFGFEEQSNL